MRDERDISGAVERILDNDCDGGVRVSQDTVRALVGLVAGERERWEPIESAPDDEPFMVGLWVTNNKTGQRWWETYIISIDDETGEAQSWPEGEPLPWALQDFEGRRPLPSPPVSSFGGR